LRLRAAALCFTRIMRMKFMSCAPVFRVT